MCFTIYIWPLKVFDPEDKGYILASELRHIMSTRGDQMTDEEVDEMVEDADLDDDGHIEYAGELTIASCSTRYRGRLMEYTGE